MYGNINVNWNTRQTYFVRLKDGKETHFREAVRQFDKDAQIKIVDGGFELCTDMDEVDIAHLTSVKSMKRMN